MKKRFFSLLCALVLCVSVTSCSGTQKIAKKVLPKKTKVVAFVPNEQNCIAEAMKAGEAEEQKEKEYREFSQKMYGTNVTVEQLYNNPALFDGIEVQIRGWVKNCNTGTGDPAVADFYIEPLTQGYGNNEKLVYIKYTLEDDKHLPLEEGNYANVYGISRGLDKNGIPIIEKVYLYTNDEGGTNFDYRDGEYNNICDYLENNTFVAPDGSVMEFPMGEGSWGWMYIYPPVVNYENCDVVYYINSQNGAIDENGNYPTCYRVALFDDGSVVTFKPNEYAEYGTKSASDGEYKYYNKKLN